MRNHSMIFDDFFNDPVRARALIGMQEIKDEKYSDGVVYPNIAHLPQSVRDELDSNMTILFGPRFLPVLSFARYSYEKTNPPHWAHSDRNIAQYLGLIYLSDGPEDLGTYTLRHKSLGFETHPDSELKKQILIAHANNPDEWEITFECPAKFNRLFVLNADLIHAAAGEYGSTPEDGRLVVSCFFNLVDI